MTTCDTRVEGVRPLVAASLEPAYLRVDPNGFARLSQLRLGWPLCRVRARVHGRLMTIELNRVNECVEKNYLQETRVRPSVWCAAEERSS